MTQTNRLYLLLFLTRPGMFILKQDEYNYISFIHGFDVGRDTETGFSEPLSKYLADKYRINRSNSGWHGQVAWLAKKRNTDWVVAFRMIAIEFLFGEFSADLECNEVLSSRLRSLVDRIQPMGGPWFDNGWIEEWKVLCHVKWKWFQAIWTTTELKVIRQLDKEIRNGNVFMDKGFPTAKLIDLRIQFDKVNAKKE